MLTRLAGTLATLLTLVAPVSGEAIRIANVGDPETLDPQKYSLVIENRILGDLFQALVDVDAKGAPIPGMAQSWDISPDGLTYTFHLRPGLQWSDGTALTTDDIVAGYRRAFDPKTAAQVADLAYCIKNAAAVADGKMPPDQLGVAAPDGATIVITLEQPRVTFIQLSSQFAIFFPVPLHVIATAGDGWVKAGTMVSNGAYQLAEWQPNDHVKLVKNAHYWDAAHVAIDEVTYFPVEDANAGLKSFRAGELDFATDFPIGQYQWLKDNLPEQMKVYPISNTFYLSVNEKHPPFGDARVRKALSLAIDREVIIKKIFYDIGNIAAWSTIPSIVPGWVVPDGADFGSRPLAERQDEARKLLSDAGFGPDNPLSFRLDFATAESNKRLAPALTSMWKEIGVEARPQFNETKAFFQMLRQSDFDIGGASWNAFPDPEFYIDLTRTGSQTNYSAWSNPEYDRLAGEAVKEIDPVKRLALFRVADALEASDVAVIPLTHGVSRNLVQVYVKGFEPNITNTHATKYLSIQR